MRHRPGLRTSVVAHVSYVSHPAAQQAIAARRGPAPSCGRTELPFREPLRPVQRQRRRRGF